ncbi:CGNR zinc finger domain-containing protein [Streptomyces sp. NPDC059009]|uniref:CGNR zinc finger domain-containing protein n=1 Tax=Streptomyces sp. NPDC059009 TaxID=3346694 RepID=UPI003680780A
MQFNHYGGEAALLAADLVNAVHATENGNTAEISPKENSPDEPPPPPPRLSPLLATRGITGHHLTPTQETELRHWARRLTDCFGPQELDRRCRTINELLADASSRPYISLHDGDAHFHYSAPGTGPAAHVRALTAAGLAYVVCFSDAHRLGRCARTGCGLAFVDTSRNGRRTYCSVRCANNDAVARHRRRQTGSQPLGG